jgi:3'(2'), 5'-bisphosphate nucleotidase
MRPAAVGDTEAVSPAAPDSTDGLSDLTDAALAADLAADAGELLLKVREEIGFGHPWALGDAGDSLANALILRRLSVERPGDAVLSEEAYDDLARVEHDRVWIIDPLDGTREFSTPGRDDWAVHIALWQRPTGDPTGDPTDNRREITDAAVSLPARGNTVYRSDTVTADAARAGVPSTIRIAVSATRPPAVLHRMRQTLAIQPVAIGSAGAKAMALIDGHVDAYVHAGGQWEWDSAAPAGVVMAAGMHASRLDGSPLRYNQLDPYLPDFVMCRAELASTLLGAIRRAWH